MWATRPTHPLRKDIMELDAIEAQLVNANRLRCITLQNRQQYRLRIEDVDGVPLTDFVELSRHETHETVQPWTLCAVTGKEKLISLDSGDEDYRLPIIKEGILRARLYPGANGFQPIS